LTQSSSNFQDGLELPETISKQAFTEFKSSALQLTTNQTGKIFQLTANAIGYSEFVTKVINAQPKEIPFQVNGHLENSTGKFRNYLVTEINQKVLTSKTSNLRTSGNDQITETKNALTNLLEIEDFIAQFQNEMAIMKFLRLIRHQHSCAIAILELNNQIDVEDSIARMSILAEVLINLAYRWSFAKLMEKSGCPIYKKAVRSTDKNNLSLSSALDGLPQNMLILAMGKFGGFELNFSSDVDLIFFYGKDGETEGARRNIENARFFQKVGVLLIRLLDDVTQDGFVFRIDMRLRPYGDSGALAISLAQAEEYYQEQGRDWERYAMVRARVISGSTTEKKCLEKIIRPFAFRRYIDYGVIDSLRNMKQMIQREVRRRQLKNNIKLGSGGIREVEFMVQSLQLIQGGRNKKLQEKSILKVIPMLVEDNLIDKSTADDLVINYRFLRRLENCIQEFEEKQTQELPVDLTQQKYLAEIMGFTTYDELALKIDEFLLNTSVHFQNLFSDNSEEEQSEDDFFLSLWEGLIDSEQLLTYLKNNKAVGSNKADFNLNEFIQHIKEFRDSKSRTGLSAKGSKRLTAIMPAVIELCINALSPVNSLLRVINILKSILKRTAYLDLMVENKPILKHLVDLVSQSEWIATRLSEHPILMDELLYPQSLYQPLKSHDLENELRQYLLRFEEDDEEALLNCIRQFKQINELRVAAVLISEQLNISQVGNYLTQLAEVIIRACIRHCWNAITSRHGVPENLTSIDDYGFAIIGYGKLGGSELGFNSDLDLVFLFDQDINSKTNGIKPISVTRFYTRLSQKLIHFLSARTNQGVLYEVDMRLRPSGNSGMLVSHIDTFRSYQNEEAWTWEHQAIIRARCVFSVSENLLNNFNSLRNEIICKKRILKDLAMDVSAMREKMRKQLDKGTNTIFDLKQGIGGLVDVEFLTQYFALKNEENVCETVLSSMIPSNTNMLIKHIYKNKKISIDTQNILVEAYNAFRNIINLRVLNNQNYLIEYNQTENELSENNQITNSAILNHQKMIKQLWLSEFERI